MLLRSPPFKLGADVDDGGEGSGSGGTHLLLANEPLSARRSSSSLWRSASAAPDATSEPRMECRLAARVDVQQHSAAGGTASAAAVSVTITAGCFVSNLTGLPLALLAEGAAAEAALPAAAEAAGAGAGGGPSEVAAHQPLGEGHDDALLSPQSSAVSLPSVPSVGSTTGMLGPSSGGGSAARQGTLLPHAATVPLLHLWHAASSKQGRAKRQSSWGSTSDMLRSFSGGLLPSPTQHAPAAPGTAAPRWPALRFALVPQERALAVAAAGDAAASAAASADEGVEPPAQRTVLHQPEGQLAPGEPTVAPGRCWSAAVSPFAAAGRQRLYLQPPSPGSGDGPGSDGGGDCCDSVMVTYRVLLNRGCFHLVLFRQVPTHALPASCLVAACPAAGAGTSWQECRVGSHFI